MLKYETALVLDFDGTVANTFELNPNGLGVSEAYENAVGVLFGLEALGQYRSSGGLKNRSPREVVRGLQIQGFLSDGDTAQLTENLVRLKIECLTSGIGQPLQDGALWPRLTLGFAEFWVQVRKNPETFTAILSSGHQAFITKTFEVHKLVLPHLTVTDDESRALPEPLSKPDPRLWQYMVERANMPLLNPVYIGDDQGKDGGLARNSGVPFLHFAPVGTNAYGHEGTFADWRDILPRFVRV